MDGPVHQAPGHAALGGELYRPARSKRRDKGINQQRGGIVDSSHASMERGGVIDLVGHVVSGAQRQITAKLSADDGGHGPEEEQVNGLGHAGVGVMGHSVFVSQPELGWQAAGAR